MEKIVKKNGVEPSNLELYIATEIQNLQVIMPCPWPFHVPFMSLSCAFHARAGTFFMAFSCVNGG